MKKNLITVLKKLLTAFGGDSEQVKNNAVDIIDKIADNASNSGSSGGVLYVNVDDVSEEYTEYKLAYKCDKTAKEISNAVSQGVVYAVLNYYGGAIVMFTEIFHGEMGYFFNVHLSSETGVVSFTFACSSENDYPIYTESR